MERINTRMVLYLQENLMIGKENYMELIISQTVRISTVHIIKMAHIKRGSIIIRTKIYLVAIFTMIKRNKVFINIQTGLRRQWMAISKMGPFLLVRWNTKMGLYLKENSGPTVFIKLENKFFLIKIYLRGNLTKRVKDYMVF